jgi:hypothetical protein
MRLRRLCFEIFAFRRFFRDPMLEFALRLSIQPWTAFNFNWVFAAVRRASLVAAPVGTARYAA